MDEDLIELITAMCTRAGMIMEDASLVAVTLPRNNPEAAKQAIDRLLADVATIRHLIEAASLLQAAVA